MAILASLRIAYATLEAQDRNVLLPEAFHGVPDLSRLNRRVGDAAVLIEESERSLVYMAIPYLVAVHHAYGLECLRVLESEGEMPPEDGGLVELGDLHDRLAGASSAALPSDLLDLFDLLRTVRNRITHYAGVRGSYLNGKWRGLPASARAGWEEVADRPFPIGPSDEELPLGIGELIACLMVVTRLGREINALVVKSLPRERWARIAADDFRSSEPQRFSQHATRSRRFRHFVGSLYSPLAFSEEELSGALGALVGD